MLRRAKTVRNATDSELESLHLGAETWAEWCVWAVVVGLVVETIIAAASLDPLWVRVGDIVSDGLVALGVFGELVLSKAGTKAQSELLRRSNTKVEDATLLAWLARGDATKASAQAAEATRKLADAIKQAGEANERAANEAPRAAEQAMAARKIDLEAVLGKEVVRHTRNTCMQAVRSLQDVLDMDKVSKNVEEERNKVRTKRVKRAGNPIIIVPSMVANAPLNLCNIKTFLEDGKFVPVDKGATTPLSVHVVKEHAQWGTVTFKVVDSASGFSEDEYSRVVAMFVSGKKWELKQITIWNDPAEVFNRIKGVYVYFDDERKADVVKAWNVTDYPLKRHSRNKDVLQSHSVCTEIYAHMQNKHNAMVQSLVQEHEAKVAAEKEARIKAEQAMLIDDMDGAGEAADASGAPVKL